MPIEKSDTKRYVLDLVQAPVFDYLEYEFSVLG